jgi:hypothetical protein
MVGLSGVIAFGGLRWHGVQRPGHRLYRGELRLRWQRARREAGDAGHPAGQQQMAGLPPLLLRSTT